MDRTGLCAVTTVEEAMRRHPAILAVFLRHRMACIGCVMSPFMTLAEAARSHGLDEADFLAELAEATETDPAEVDPSG